ncbi:MAG: (d)CMP kinase [Bdellovibrionales bacterium]|jgi:cytidylate kinase
MTTPPIIIAVDGLAATGKGTIARRLATHWGYAYLDTGALYRAVGVGVLQAGGDSSDPAAAEKAALALNPHSLQAMEADGSLRTPAASDAASKVAAIQGVRNALLKFQQDFAALPPLGKKGAVLDGRDIGTVIAPHANVKIFVEAAPEIRAHRRFLELQGRGENVTEAAVLADMQARDARDASRATAPTKPAADAVLLDTSDLNADQAFEKAVGIVEKKIN